MNEEIETAINKIKETIRLWEIYSISNDNTADKINTARTLEFQLTMLKLLIGINNFDELPYFNRVLKYVSNYLNSIETNKEIQK